MPKKGSSKFTPRRERNLGKQRMSARRNSDNAPTKRDTSTSNTNQASTTASDRGESTSNVEQETSNPIPKQRPKISNRRKAVDLTVQINAQGTENCTTSTDLPKTPINQIVPHLPLPSRSHSRPISRLTQQFNQLRARSTSPRTPLTKNAPSTTEIMEVDETPDEASIAAVVGATPDNTQTIKTSATKKKIVNKTKTTAVNTTTSKRRFRKEFAHKRARILRRADIPRLINARQIQFQKKHILLIEERMQQVMKQFEDRPWPTEKKKSKQGTTKDYWEPLCQRSCKCKTSEECRQKKCRGQCDCTSYAQCQQNANAYMAASKYIKTHLKHRERKQRLYVEQKLAKLSARPTWRCHNTDDANDEGHSIKCASAGANHRVDYYDSGQFGDAVCDFCENLMLKNQYKRSTKTPCCHNASAHTDEMKKEYEELQNPPEGFIENLVEAEDELKEKFLNNTFPLNHTFAFASTTAKRVDQDQMSATYDLCKYNGNISHHFSDLTRPEGSTQPLFAQTYTLDPDEAIQFRTTNCKNIGGKIGDTVGPRILAELERLLRENPLGKTFATTGQMIAKIKDAENVPKFQVVLVTDRDINVEVLRARDDCEIIPRDENAPNAEQMAVVWVSSEEGEAPDVQGFWIGDKAGHMKELKNHDHMLDGACFPLLHPRATKGYRWFIKKGKEMSRRQTATDQEYDQEFDIGVVNLDGENFIQQQYRQNVREEQHAHDDDEFDEVANQANAIAEGLPMEVDEAGPSERPLPKKRVNISERQFYKYRFALRVKGRNEFHWLWFARKLAEFFLIAVLNRIERNQLDHQKKMQEKKNLTSMIASEFKEAIAKGVKRDMGAEGKLGKVFLMNKTFAGSNSYYREKYADLMTIVQNLGNPTWFVTFTGNPQWPEIVGALQKGQKYTHRPDIVCQIFMDKVEEFLKDILSRHVLGKVASWCYSVEHQKRGMPHIHLLLILDKDHRITTPEQVDQYVSARIPPLPEMDDLSPEANQQRRLWHTVTTSMLHDCNKACEGRIPDKCNKYFPKEFSAHTVLSAERYAQYVRMNPQGTEEAVQDEVGANPSNEETIVIEPFHNADKNQNATTGPSQDNAYNAQVQYRRLKPPADDVIDWKTQGLTYWKYVSRGQRKGFIPINDDRVVSYNPYLLLKYGCHINIEYVFGQKACKYLFKYILKGFTKAYVKVIGEKDVYNYDEMAAYFTCRYMTAMEAWLRLYSYTVVDMKHQIVTLRVHEEDGQTIIMEEGQEEAAEEKLETDTQLTAFFKLCRGDPDAAKLCYQQIPYYYSWDPQAKLWKKRLFPKSEDPEKATLFVRVYGVSAHRPELLAIRLLLMNRKGPTSFPDLRTVDGKDCITFVKAAQELGLLADDAMFVGAMEDACNQLMGRQQLQRYFAMLVCHANPSDPAKLLDDFLDKIYPAPTMNDGKGRHPEPPSREFRRKEVLKCLEYYFRAQGTSCSKLGIEGLPLDYNHERQAALVEGEALEEMFYGGKVDKKKSHQKMALEAVESLNEDQKAAFEEIKASIMDKSRGKRLFFIEGSGGCGKTFFYNTLIRWLLAGKPPPNFELHHHELESSSVIAAASTGIAALLLIGGATAHRQFYIPNDVNYRTPPNVNYESAGAQKFRDADVIIIDEISMLDRVVLNYIDRLLRHICNSNEIFGGKVVILGGDWQQLTPVIEGGGRQEQIAASIKNDPLFKKYATILKLTKNMRAAEDEIKLIEWLKEIGRGMEDGKYADEIKIPKENQSESLDDLIHFCFPEDVFDNPLEHSQTFCDAAILCPRIEDVKGINEKALYRLKGEATRIESYDCPLPGHKGPETRYDPFRHDLTVEAIHREEPSSLPPHVLYLKVGTPVMLLRNLDTSQGLSNGTRLQVLKITDHNLLCRILTGPRANANVLLPRVRFQHGAGSAYRGAKFQRIQFPVKLCFAMTINKAQGQTLKKMGLALHGHQPFGHGHVYVAMSRVTSMNGIRVFSPRRGEEMPIRNVVYQELLDNIPIRPVPPAPEPIWVEDDAELGEPEPDFDMY